MDISIELTTKTLYAYHDSTPVRQLSLKSELDNMPQNYIQALNNKYPKYDCVYLRAVDINGILYTFIKIFCDSISCVAVIYYNYEVDLDSTHKIEFIFCGFHMFNINSAQIRTYNDYIIVDGADKNIDIEAFGRALDYIIRFRSKKNIQSEMSKYGKIAVLTTRINVFNVSDVEWIY